MNKQSKEFNRIKKAQTYLTEAQYERLEKRAQELGWPDKAKYIRCLILEGVKHDYPFENA